MICMNNSLIKVMVLTGNGINCEKETAFACREAGATVVDMISIWEWATGKVSIENYGMICFPGGFLDGDDLGAARACATRIKFSVNHQTDLTLLQELIRFVNQGKLIIGICNGFQLLVKLGLLPGLTTNSNQLLDENKPLTQTSTLTFNVNGRFEDRWVTIVSDPLSPCIFTKNIEIIDLPVRHAEGRLLISDSIVDKVRQNHLIPLYYADPVNYKPTEQYPFNPNGSPYGAAALCDPSGRILGMMPHPECFWSSLNHPDWSKNSPAQASSGAGLKFFINAMQYLKHL